MQSRFYLFQDGYLYMGWFVTAGRSASSWEDLSRTPLRCKSHLSAIDTRPQQDRRDPKGNPKWLEHCKEQPRFYSNETRKRECSPANMTRAVYTQETHNLPLDSFWFRDGVPSPDVVQKPLPDHIESLSSYM